MTFWLRMMSHPEYSAMYCFGEIVWNSRHVQGIPYGSYYSLDPRNVEQTLFVVQRKSAERLERHQENEQRSSSKNSFLWIFCCLKTWSRPQRGHGRKSSSVSTLLKGRWMRWMLKKIHHICSLADNFFDSRDATTSYSRACSRSAQHRLAVKSIVLL